MNNNLNDRQKEAVEHLRGPVRIIAGPGSGKTRTIVAKALNILNNNYSVPYRILILTFTNKAANEIKNRIHEEIGDVNFKNVFTYHGLASYFLRTEAKRLNIEPDYVIIDSKDKERLIKEQLRLVNTKNDNVIINAEPRDLSTKFSVYKVNSNMLELDRNKNDYTRSIAKLYDKYETRKKELKLYDFDDLLVQFNNFLESNHEVRDIWQNKYDYIFIDEFQDTNELQYDIIRKITKEDSNITVVGDPDQNIYSWRGADIGLILNFDKDYKDVKTVILNENYRSAPTILKVANNLISNNKDRIEFENKAIKREQTNVNVIACKDRKDEARRVVAEIEKLKSIRNISYDKMAIIFRSNYVSKDFEFVLSNWGISYTLIGGFRFFDRVEVKETLNYFRFLYFRDDFSLKQIINVPARKVGDVTWMKFEEKALEEGKTVWEYITSISESLKGELRTFVDETKIYIEEQIGNGEKIYIKFKKYLENVGFINLYANKEESKLENVESLIDQIKTIFQNKGENKEEIINFYNNSMLQSSSDISSIENHVTLITAHASKGLEFDVVFFVGFNEGIIPTKRIIENPAAKNFEKQIEEERRVAYVGVTRAKNELYITYSTDYDFITRKPLVRSRFIDELDLESSSINFIGDLILEPKEIKEINKNYEVPKGFTSKDTNNVFPGDIIWHIMYGEGVIVSQDDEFIKVAFERKVGIKEVMIGHESYFKKE